MGNCFSKSDRSWDKSREKPPSTNTERVSQPFETNSTPVASPQTSIAPPQDVSISPAANVKASGKPSNLAESLRDERAPVTAGAVPLEEELPDPVTFGLLSSRTEVQEKGSAIKPERKILMLDLGIQVIEVIQGGTAVASLVSGGINPVSDILKKITGILEILKKMIENDQMWRHLLTTVDEHQEVFNEQLKRMEAENLVPDSGSALLSPIKQYSEALEELAKGILEDSRFQEELSSDATGWQKIKEFTKGFILVNEEKEQIQEHQQRLVEIMGKFKVSLAIYLSFTVQGIKAGQDSMSLELRDLGDNVKEMREMIVRLSEPKDTINTPLVTALGGQHHKCLKGTRVDVMEEINNWAKSTIDSPHPVYCIGDVAGTGKSTIARTLVAEWQENRQIKLFPFFFSQQGASTKTASDFCFLLREQLRYHSGSALQRYWDSCPPDTLLREEPLERQWSTLVLGPMSRLLRMIKDPERHRCIVIMDALDECTAPSREELLKLFLSAFSSGSFLHLRLLLTTRMEDDLRAILHDKAYRDLTKFTSLINSPSTTADIGLYVTTRLDQMDLLTSAPDERRQLIARCGGLFIFAFLACKLLEDACAEEESLADILEKFTSLDSLYHQTLVRADRNLTHTRASLRNMLGIILVAQRPLSIVAIADLSAASLKLVTTLVRRLGSVLSSGDIDDPVSILHETFTDYLLRPRWMTKTGFQTTNEYAISGLESNRAMAVGCLSALMKLHPNLCNIDTNTNSTTLHHAMKQIPMSLEYAASAWITHVIPELQTPKICDDTREILRGKLLNWIELGGITKKLSSYIQSLQRLHTAMKGVHRVVCGLLEEDDLCWSTRILEFIRSNKDTIEHSPLHVYSSAIAFCPRDSPIYPFYEPSFRDSLPRICLGYPKSDISNTLFSRHASPVSHVAYSVEGDLIVAAVGEMRLDEPSAKVIIWDAQTGAKLSLFCTPQGHGACIAVGFLPGSETVVSLWKDGGLYHFNHKTGGLSCISTLSNAMDYIMCADWAPDWGSYVCGRPDGSLQRFTVDNGKEIGKAVKAHEKWVYNVTFSPNGHLVSSTFANTLKIWEISSNQLSGPVSILNHSKNIAHGTFLPFNPSSFAFVDYESLCIYNVTHGTIEFQYSVISSLISHSWDGTKIAIRCYDPQYVQLLDRSNTGALDSPTVTTVNTRHSAWTTCMAISPDKERLLTGGTDGTIRVHMLTGMDSGSGFSGHHTQVHQVAFTFDRKKLASVDTEGLVCLWNVEGGGPIGQPIKTGIRRSEVMAISSDGSVVACWYQHETIKFWSTKSGEQIGCTLVLGYEDIARYHIGSVLFSPDDAWLAVCAEDTCDRLQGGKLTLVGIRDILTSTGTFLNRIELQLKPFQKRLAYHPSGRYICNGEQVWDLSSSPPLLLTDQVAASILEEAFRQFLVVENTSNPFHWISLTSSKDQLFYLPQNFPIQSHMTHGGLVALGSADGKVMALDLTHLLSPADRESLERIDKIRHGAQSGSGQTQIHQLVSGYTGPPKVSIPLVDFVAWEVEEEEGDGEDSEHWDEDEEEYDSERTDEVASD